MKTRAIGTLSVAPSGELFVSPVVSEPGLYRHIYREANGLRWDVHRQAIFASEPHRWRYPELLQHIAATLRASLDEDLQFAEDTAWVGVSPELQVELRRALETGERSGGSVV